MTRPDGGDRLDDMASLWSAPVVPVEEPGTVEARREPTVDAIGRAIRQAHRAKRLARRRRVVLGGVAAAAAAVMALGAARWAGSVADDAPSVVAMAPAPSVELETYQGALSVERDGRRESVRSGARRELRAGDAVVAELQSSGSVALSALTHLDVASATRLHLEEVGNRVPRVRVDRGHIGARVDEPHDGTPKLVVETPDATLVVVGTVFTVDVGERDSDRQGFTAVAVLRGTVVVEREGEEVARVEAGQAWSSRPTSEARGTGPADPSPEAVSEVDHAVATVHRPAHPPREVEPEAVPGTLAVENRLFQQAIAARNRGDDATVVRRMSELIRAFPQSPLAEEARGERQRALERLETGTQAASTP